MLNLAGLQVNSIITDASTFTARLNALEQEGVTNIVQRPQVVTLNDAEAVIESTQSVYVPVSGAFDEDLFGVMAGTVLRVTPHIIVDNGRQRIRLLVTIEDGNIQVSNQPTTGTEWPDTQPGRAVRGAKCGQYPGHHRCRPGIVAGRPESAREHAHDQQDSPPGQHPSVGSPVPKRCHQAGYDRAAVPDLAADYCGDRGESGWAVEEMRGLHGI